MATQIPTAVQNAMCDLAVDRIDAGAAAGTMQIRTGSPPGPNAAATGTLLATITFSDPAFGAAAAGVATMSGAPLSTTAVADGTAGWFRIRDSDGTTVVDGTVTVTGGGGQLQLSSTTISTGLSVSIIAGTATQPAS